MNIYIPIIEILWGLLAYAIIGIVLFVPLVYWQARFLSNYGTEFARPVWEGIRIFKGLFNSSWAWPVILGYTIKTEIKYRRKGYLPKKK